MTPRLITSKFSGKCAKCRSPFDAGAVVYYDKDAAKGYKSWHAECNSAPVAPKEPQAPTSAGAEPATRTDSGNILHESHFDSVSAFCAIEPHALNMDYYNALHDHKGGSKSLNWYGVEGGWYGAIEAIANGWADGLRRVEELLESVTVPPIAGLRRRVVRGDHGSEFDIHRVYSGDFENAWSRRERRHAAFGHAQKTILVNLSAHCKTSADALFWRGAAAIKLADAFVDGGYSVEIVAMHSARKISEDKKHDMSSTIVIKPFEMPLDRLELSTVTCLSGFLRTHGFKHTISHPFKADNSLGYPTDVCNAYTGPDVIRGLHTIETRQQAQDFINRTIRSLTHEDQQAA